MDSYKTSKAWHFGHSLALDVHKMAKQIPADDEFGLAEHIKRVAAAGPLMITESLERNLEKDKLECYRLAREAMIELQEHLSLARDLHYIEYSVFKDLADKAITAQNILSSLIRRSRGAEYNKS